jgi:hypothetical protein
MTLPIKRRVPIRNDNRRWLLSRTIVPGYQLGKNVSCRLLKKTSEVSRAKFDELKRTLQYVEASRASATTPMSLFSSLLVGIADPGLLAPIIDAADYHIARIKG